MATPYIDSQPLDASVGNSETGSAVPVVRSLENVEAEIEETTGCSGINLNDPNVVKKIQSYGDFAANSSYATDSSKIFVLTNDIDCGGEIIQGNVYPTFNASFEGNCFSITNFTITNGSGGDNVGFFGTVKATSSPIYIKNVTFKDFAFNINNPSNYIGVFAKTASSTSSPSENDVIFENVTVHLNQPSLITIQSASKYFYFGGLIGQCLDSKLLDCNVILSHRIDMYVNSENLKNLTFGAICGLARNSSIMACSANLIGSDIVLNTSNDKLTFGLLCGRTWYNKASYLNLLNNMIILKDASLKTNYTMTNYGYLIGVRWGTPIVTAKNNTVMSFVDGLYFGGDDKLSRSNLNVEENNKINNLASTSPSEVSIKDQIYGMKLDTDDTYWKKVYYVYYEGDTSNMGCRYYDVFNFWKNTELGTYCVEDDMCNTHMYGTCDSGEGRRGWSQFGGNVSVKCNRNGNITYKLKTDIDFASYESIILDAGITFNGNNKTITHSGSGNWPGLFTFIKRDYKINVTIKNVTINLGGKKLGYGHGSILANSAFSWGNGGDFANYNIKIVNCHVLGGSMNNWSGGIVGQGFCSNQESKGSIVNCSNSCNVSGKNCGGICAPNCGRYGKLEVRSCWNEGSLTGYANNGGIMGYNTGSNDVNSYVFVFNCYNTGDLETTSGGICASSNNNGERVMILNCYSTCEIEDLDNTDYSFGGIVAASNTNFQPFVLYCDVYLTGNYTYNDNYDTDKIVSRNGYRSINTNATTENNLINSIGLPYEEKYHTLNFNSTTLKSLIDTLPYDFISPVWDTDNLTIPN